MAGLGVGSTMPSSWLSSFSLLSLPCVIEGLKWQVLRLPPSSATMVSLEGATASRRETGAGWWVVFCFHLVVSAGNALKEWVPRARMFKLKKMTWDMRLVAPSSLPIDQWGS